MTPNEFKRLLKANEAALKKAIQRDLPVKIGDTAVYHFRDNFRAGGFVNKKSVARNYFRTTPLIS